MRKWVSICSVMFSLSSCVGGVQPRNGSDTQPGAVDAGTDASSTGTGTDGGNTTPPQTAFCSALGNFPNAWIAGGPDCGAEIDVQVHQLNPDTFILRQSLCTTAEAPFLYLLFGEDKVLLQDTGDIPGNAIVNTVNSIVQAREVALGRDLELVVVNSHGHGDHVRGNPAFANSGATMVGTSVNQITAFFSMQWPRVAVSYDLGNRIIDVMGVPGHQAAHIAIYDRQYGILLTGDSLYPGRLYMNGNFSEFKQSIGFLNTFAASRDICAVLGTHIEMTAVPGVDYPFGNAYRPNERTLQLTRETLDELNAALVEMGVTPTRTVHNDFIIVP